MLIAEGADRPPSRNKHFADWEDPAQNAAFRLFGRLLDVQEELEWLVAARGAASLAPLPPSEGDGHELELVYELDLPQGRVRRAARFLPEELDLLRRLCGQLLTRALKAGTRPSEGM